MIAKKKNKVRGIIMWSSNDLLELVSLILLDGVLIKKFNMTSMVYTNCTDHSLAYIHLCVTITVRDPLVSGVMAVPLGLCEIVPLQ